MQASFFDQKFYATFRLTPEQSDTTETDAKQPAAASSAKQAQPKRASNLATAERASSASTAQEAAETLHDLKITARARVQEVLTAAPAARAKPPSEAHVLRSTDNLDQQCSSLASSLADALDALR